MEMYDEDLTSNSFFKKLQKESPVLYDVATRRRWLICVPRQGALGCCEFTDTDFENHILFQEEGHDDSQYFTVNKKELVIKHNVITTKTGFEEERIVPILFEETFFNKNDESYLVLCINQPLEGNTSYGESSTLEGQIVLHHITDCADLLFRKKGNMKVGTALDDHMRGFLQSLAQLERHALDTLLTETMTFYAKGLQIVMKDHALKKQSQSEEGFYITLKVALESYLMHNVYRHLFVNISTCVAQKDARMNKISRNLRDLQLKDLDVRPEFCQNVPKARRELSNLSRYFTPLGKLICLKRVFRVLMQGGSPTRTEEVQHLSTDDLLPMVIFLIIKADEEHWWAIFTYVTTFRFSKQNTDNEYGFFLATVEAALEHIASKQINKYLLSRKVKEMSVSYSSKGSSIQETLWQQQEQEKSHLDEFFQCVFVGDLTGLRGFLSEELSPLADTSLLCHPLCDCHQCKKLLDQKEREKRHMKVSLDSYDDRGWTALHLSSWCGHVDIIDWLVQSGVDINIKDVQGHTPLHVACMAGQQSSALLVLHLQANPNIQDNENNTALHLAALHSHEDCVKALAYYDQGNTALDTEMTNDFGDTALHLASRWGYLSICQILLESGAEVTPRNRKNLTPVDVSHNLIVMNLLQSRLRPHPNAPTVLKPQARNLSYQKQRRRSSTSREQVKSSPKIVTTTNHGNSGKWLPKEKPSNPKIEKLLTAVLNRDLPMIQFHMGWTEDGLEVEIPSSSPVTEETLCHPLCQCPKCAPVQQLRSPAGKDIHINSQNAEGMSPLHVAAQCGYLEICRLFMQRGALVNLATNTQGYTPLHLAVKHQKQEVVKFLLRQKCELDLTDARGNAAVHHAAICGTDTVLTALLDYGSKMNVQNAKGNTALHECSSAGHVTCVKLLIAYGADVEMKNSKGQTAIQLSSCDTVRALFRYAAMDSTTKSSKGPHGQMSTTSLHKPTIQHLSSSDTVTGQQQHHFSKTGATKMVESHQDSLLTGSVVVRDSQSGTVTVHSECIIDTGEKQSTEIANKTGPMCSAGVGGRITNATYKTDGPCTDQWTFIPLNDPSEGDRMSVCSVGQHTDKKTLGISAEHRLETKAAAVTTTRCHDNDGFVILDPGSDSRQASGESTSLHSVTESSSDLSFKDEYFNWSFEERQQSVSSTNTSTTSTIASIHPNLVKSEHCAGINTTTSTTTTNTFSTNTGSTTAGVHSELVTTGANDVHPKLVKSSHCDNTKTATDTSTCTTDANDVPSKLVKSSHCDSFKITTDTNGVNDVRAELDNSSHCNSTNLKTTTDTTGVTDSHPELVQSGHCESTKATTDTFTDTSTTGVTDVHPDLVKSSHCDSTKTTTDTTGVTDVHSELVKSGHCDSTNNSVHCSRTTEFFSPQSLDDQKETYQIQTLHTVEWETESILSDEEFIYKKSTDKPVNCDSLSEDSRTESEKDLSVE